MIYASCICMLGFSNWMDIELRQVLGIVLIAIVFITIICNVALIAVLTLKGGKQYIRREIYRRNRKALATVDEDDTNRHSDARDTCEAKSIDNPRSTLQSILEEKGQENDVEA